MKKPAQGKVFKGWVTTDGKNTWHPHFAKSRDPDPKFETYERVQYETTKKGNKDCSCPCYCDNTTTTTPTNNLLLVPRTRSTSTRSNSRGGRNDRARSPSPGALNHFRLVTAAIRHILPERPDGVEKTKRLEVLRILADREHEGLHFLILFNGAQTRKYKGFYGYDRMKNEIFRLHGEGPLEIDVSKLARKSKRRYYSFDSATKRFDKFKKFNTSTIHAFTV